MSLTRTLFIDSGFVIIVIWTEVRDAILAGDVKACVIRTDVDRETSSSLRLATNRTVTVHERVRMRGIHRELYTLAATGTFEFHRRRLSTERGAYDT